MTRNIWQSVENPEQLYGDTEDLVKFNQQKGGTMVIDNNTAYDIINNNEEPNTMPSTVPQQKTKKKKEKKTIKNEKIINIAATQDGKKVNIQVKQVPAEEPMVMPPVVLQENQLGYSSPSLIRTGEDDVLEKMKECGQEDEEEPLVIPPVVGK